MVMETFLIIKLSAFLAQCIPFCADGRTKDCYAILIVSLMRKPLSYTTSFMCVQCCINLKGQSHEIFCIRFFHQSAHSGRTRDVL